MTETEPSDTSSGTPDELRGTELVIWDRILKRWNEKVIRMITIVGGTVSVFAVVVSFLGASTMLQSIEDNVRDGVNEAAEKIQDDIKENTKFLSERLGKELALMSVKTAKLNMEAESAQELVKSVKTDVAAARGLVETVQTDAGAAHQLIEKVESDAGAARRLVENLEKDAVRFSELDKVIRKQMSETESRIETFTNELNSKLAGMEAAGKKIQTRMADFDGKFATLYQAAMIKTHRPIVLIRSRLFLPVGR